MSFQDFGIRNITHERSSSRCRSGTSFSNQSLPTDQSKRSTMEGNVDDSSTLTGIDRLRVKYKDTISQEKADSMAWKVEIKANSLCDSASPDRRNDVPATGNNRLRLSQSCRGPRMSETGVSDTSANSTSDFEMSYGGSDVNRRLNATSLSSSIPRAEGITIRMNEEVTLFKRDIEDLKIIVQNLCNSPSDTREWSCRQKIDALEKRGVEIGESLRTQENSIQSMTRSEAAAARAMHTKLSRNFRYVLSTLKTLKLDFRQIISRHGQPIMNTGRREFIKNSDENVNLSNHGIPSSSKLLDTETVLKHEEDYAYRVMHERESAIMEINKKMHDVNEIYKDLGNIVSQQQELIDNAENAIEDSRLNLKSGLNQLEKANGKGNKDDPIQRPAAHTLLPSRSGEKKQHRFQSLNDEQNIDFDQSRYDSAATPRCGLSLPFDSFKMSEVRNDLAEMGNGVVGYGKSALRLIQGQMIALKLRK